MNKSNIPAQTEDGSKLTAVKRLDSWKDIARYLNRDVRTVQRWEKTDGLPIHRLAGGRKKGSPVYAFISEIEAWLHKNPQPVLEQEPDSSLNSTSGWKPGQVLLAVLVIGFLAVGAIAGWRIFNRQRSVPPIHVLQLTSYPGVERHPAFSPNGDWVAFGWNGNQQDNFDIYVKYVDGGEPRRLTADPGVDGWPIWSPDGHFIAFGRWIRGAQKAEILVIPAISGSEQVIHEFTLPFQASEYWPAGCWTPDSKWLITTIGSAALGLVSPETHKVRQLTQPEEGSPGDYGPALSPNGRNLAFLRASSGPIWNLFIQQLDPEFRPEGPPRQLTYDPEGVENPMWSGDGREILFITDRDGERRLWRIPYDGSSSPSPVETLGRIGYYWSISPSGNRLVYSDNKMNDDIWRMDLQGEKEVRRIGFSSRKDFNPQISPNGERIAYLSSQEKGRHLYVSEADGTNPIVLASITAGKRPGPARWSPDGKELVFECRKEGDNEDICAVPSVGGPDRRLTHDPGRDVLPSWSRDGKWIYVTSNRSGSWQIWKIPSDGSEDGARQITKGGGFAAVESIDGRIVFSREMLSSNLWSIPVEGGEETQIGDFHIYQCHTYALNSEGIYYTSSENPEQWFDIRYYRFSDGKTESVGRINMRLQRGISLSPDNKYLLFTSTESAASDLNMVENFR